MTSGSCNLAAYIKATFAERLSGYPFRFAKLLDPSARRTWPVLSYSEIDKVGARMYRGEAVGVIE